MLSNYLAAALRSLARNRVCAFVSVAGLAIGLAAAILIGLYVREELDYEHWIPGHADVYRVAMGLQLDGARTPPSAGAAAPVAQWLQADYPQIAVVARLKADRRNLRVGSEDSSESVYWADPQIFDVLPLPTIAGDPHAALQAPDAMVMTRRMARRYFHTDDALGRAASIDGTHLFRLAAILEDLPPQTHLATEILLSARSSFSTLPPPGVPLRLDVAFDELASVLTYVRLKPGSSPSQLRQTLQQKMAAHVPIPRGPGGRPLVPAPLLHLQPLGAIHFMPAGAHAMKPADDPRLLRWIAAVGGLVLLVATMNFINLMTTRGMLRVMEVGVRKVAGAWRRDLAWQFLGESMLLVAVSVLLAAVLVEWLLSFFNSFLGQGMRFDWWRDPPLASALVLTAIAVALGGGAYPALVLSRIGPTEAVKGSSWQPVGKPLLREVLVTLQFAALIGLLLVTAVIYRQNRFSTDGAQVDMRRLLVLDHGCDNGLPDALRTVRGVAGVACTDAQFGIDGGWVGVSTPVGQGAPIAVTYVAVDRGLLELVGLQPDAGRFFSPDHPADVTTLAGGDLRTGSGGAAVINETAVRSLGFASAAAAIGQPAAFGQNAATPPTIIGVVRDFPLFGTRRGIPPVVFRLTPQAYRYLLVKFDTGSLPETLQAVRERWRQFDPRPFNGRFLDGAVRVFNLDTLRQAQVFSLFAGVTALIACLGLFGLSAHMARCRTREIGIRKALGASTRNVLQLMLWQFSKPVLWANLIAWPVAGYLMRRWLAAIPYHVGLDPWLFLAAGTAALLIAWGTVAAQSLRAALANPVAALRHE